MPLLLNTQDGQIDYPFGEKCSPKDQLVERMYQRENTFVFLGGFGIRDNLKQVMES